MTDLEISRALALAIGWNGNCVRVISGQVCCYEKHVGWRVFDYRYEVIAFRVAERFDAFPYQAITGGWVSSMLGHHDTPQKAIALAVIGAKK